jgi:hypothetical protein
MNKRNPLETLFRVASEIINGAETSFLDLLSAIVPYAVPVIPAYLTYWHTKDWMMFPHPVALTAAFVVEVLGITAVSTAIRFYRHNQRYKDAKNHAPFRLAIGVYAFYLIIVLAVNVIGEVDQGTRSGAVILGIALFALLSVPSGVLISIRTQFKEMLDERTARKIHGSTPLLTVNNADTGSVAVKGDWRRDSKNLSPDELRAIAYNMKIDDIARKYGLKHRAAVDWKANAKGLLEKK